VISTLSTRARRAAFSIFATSLLVAGLGVAAPACREEAPNGETYTVATTYLPQRIDPRRNMINVFHYINLQLYYPLMTRQGPNNNLTSAFLDMQSTRTRSARLDAYALCLTPGVRFSDGSPITAHDLEVTLEEVHAAQRAMAHLDAITRDDRCVYVTLDRPDPMYLDKLTVVSTTLLKADNQYDVIPVGLGPYRVEAWDAAHLRLRYVGADATARFKHVEYVKIRDVAEAQRRGLMDLNLLAWAPERDAALETYQRVPTPVHRTYLLVVAHPDEAVRRQMVSCLDMDAFNDVLGLGFQPVLGYLPRGLLGSHVDFRQIKPDLYRGACHFPGPKPRVAYYNHLPDAQGRLSQYFAAHADALPFDVSVELHPYSDIIQSFLAGKTFLFLIGVDLPTSQSAQIGEPSQFFERFYGEQTFVPRLLHDLEALVDAALVAPSHEEKRRLYETAHRALLESGYLVVLGERLQYLYYPTDISHIEFAESIVGYPRIESIK
jgi:hypothetical protein